MYSNQPHEISVFTPFLLNFQGSTAVILTMIVLAVVLNSQLMAGEKRSKEVRKKQVSGFGFPKPHSGVRLCGS